LAAADGPRWFGLSLTVWIRILILTALIFWLFYTPNLRRLWDKTNPFTGEPNWGHSVFVPIVGLYYLYLNRDELLRAKVRPLLGGSFSIARLAGGGIVLLMGLCAYVTARFVVPESLVEYAASAAVGLAGLGLFAIIFDWGFGILLSGLLLFGYGIWPGQNDWLKDFGMVVTLFGIVLTLCGWQVMKVAWFPILFLVCALPWPGLVYSKIAGPLQHLAAKVAVGVLSVCGAPSYQNGTKIVIQRVIPPDRVLNVAEACAGLRSLMTFISVGAMVAFLSIRPLWQKIVITLSAIPIAIFCNVMRVAGQGLLDHYVSEELSQSYAHQFVGLVMLLPAFLLILLVGWVVDQIFIEEVEEPRPQVIKRRVQKTQGESESLATAPRRQQVSSTPTEGT